MEEKIKLRVCVVASEPEKMPRLQQEVSSLRKAGYDVEVLRPWFRRRFRPRPLSAALRYGSLALQALFKNADIFHVFNIPDIIGLPIVARKYLGREKLIYDVRNPWAEEVFDIRGAKTFSKVCGVIERFLTKRADIVIAANRVLAERALSWGAKKVFSVPNYPSEDFKPTVDSSEFKRSLGLDRKRIVLFIGNFEKVECAYDLAKLFKDVVKRVPDAILLFVGDGPQKEAIETFIEENGLEDSIRVIGRVPHSEIPNWISIADICVTPRSEKMRSSPFYCPESIWKVTEALYLGRPVIASPVGGFRGTEWPIIVAPLEDFPKVITSALENPPKVKRMEDLSWKHSEEKLLEAYANLAGADGETKPKILITAGGGGHSGYAVSVARQLFGKAKLFFLADRQDSLSQARLRPYGEVYKVHKPRDPSTPLHVFAFRFVWCTLQSALAWLKIRPKIIVSTGTNLAIPICIVGKVLGSKIVNTDDSIRIFSTSKTSRYLDYLAEVTLLQWPEQEKFHGGKGVFVGLLVPEARPSSRDGGILITGGSKDFPELMKVALEADFKDVVATMGNLDSEPFREKGWKVGKFIGLDEILEKADVCISHLGYTVWEAVNYRVPVVVVPNPLWWKLRKTVDESEQLIICKAIEERGYGIFLPFEELTPQNLRKAVERAKKMTPAPIIKGSLKAAQIVLEIAK